MTVIVDGTVSGLGVITDETGVSSGLNPLATTRISKSLGVAIPTKRPSSRTST